MKKIEIINDDHGGAPLGLLSVVGIAMVAMTLYGDPLFFIIDPLAWIAGFIAVMGIKFDLKNYDTGESYLKSEMYLRCTIFT